MKAIIQTLFTLVLVLPVMSMAKTVTLFSVDHPAQGTGLIQSITLDSEGMMTIDTYDERTIQVQVSGLNMTSVTSRLQRLSEEEARSFSKDVICYKMPPRHYMVAQVATPFKGGELRVISMNADCTATEGVVLKEEYAQGMLRELIDDFVLIARQEL